MLRVIYSIFRNTYLLTEVQGNEYNWLQDQVANVISVTLLTILLINNTTTTNTSALQVIQILLEYNNSIVILELVLVESQHTELPTQIHCAQLNACGDWL